VSNKRPSGADGGDAERSKFRLSPSPGGEVAPQPAYRQRIADALFAAIRKYQTSLKNVGQIAHQ
jgi:hypothetical protein